jgi:hypothetical protein
LSRNNNLVVKYSRTFQQSHDLLGEMNEFYVVYAIKFMLDDWWNIKQADIIIICMI